MYCKCTRLKHISRYLGLSCLIQSQESANAVFNNTNRILIENKTAPTMYLICDFYEMIQNLNRIKVMEYHSVLKITFLWCHDVHAPRALILSINISRLFHFSKTITYSSIVIFNTNEKSWCNYFLHFVMQNIHFLHVLVKINFEDIFFPWHYFFYFLTSPLFPKIK